MEKYIKIRRIIALIGVILLVLMVIATLFVACISFPGSDKVFIGLLAMDIMIPIFIFALTYVTKVFNDSHNANVD